MLEELKKRVYAANQDLVAKGFVLYTWGNVSEVDRENGLIVIKPSGVDYSVMKPDDMMVVENSTGETVEGKWNPSSDMPTHLELYRVFSQIKGVKHTHSTNAVVFAQAGMAIPALGTTHADYFYGDIPCTKALSRDEVEVGYETNTGKVMVDTVRQSGYDVLDIPGILVKNHGPFAWGTSSSDSVYKAVVMEAVANMALKALLLNPNSCMPQYILDKHYFRKHGPKAYYGQ
jgi:L-ribulose-5-phosphate 4-epimerase